MPLAIDSVAGFATNPGAALAAVTAATGDSFTVRNFPATATATLEAIVRGGATSGSVQVKSPMMHDNVRGIEYTSAEDPAVFLLPRQIGQRLVPQDTLAVSVSGGGAETDLAVLRIYYSDLTGGSARLHSWGDISGIIRNIKPVEVDCVTSATVGEWTDTLITTTENLLHANTDYAVLGYVCDVAVAYVAVKGTETNNLRVGGPGTTATDDTADYFVEASDYHQTPHIPVVNSANAGGIYVSTVHNAASTDVKVQLVLAELSQNLAS